MPISKNKIKWIHSLEMKKYRKETGCFLAEGPKLVAELLPCFRCQLIVATAQWLNEMGPKLPSCEVVEVTAEELAKASLLKSPQQVLALFSLPEEMQTNAGSLLLDAPRKGLCLALDGVQDPGNLGTIIRLADWFGIEHIFCSPSTADAFSPKCVQATMGALARVKLHYTSLPELITALPDVPVYATLLDGENIYTQPLTSNGLIIMGNEGNGISEEVRGMVNRKLFVPNYPPTRSTSESLNVAIATAIVCAEFRRQLANS
ncbi:MAG: TrmH family RNA methyltransferase [Bacteroides sp.]